MRKIAALVAFVIFCIADSASFAAGTHVGTWEERDGDSFFRLELQPDGSCFAVAGGKEDGIGGQCRYTISGSNINITEFEENGKLKEVPSQYMLQFKYDEHSDSISTVSPALDSPRKLARSTRKRAYAD